VQGYRRPAYGRGALLLVAALCLAGVGAALVSQHVYGMQPCPWCILQRLIFVVIAVVALLCAAAAPLRKPGAAAVVLLALAGMASAAYQHFVAAKSQSCNLTLADRIVSGLGLDTLLPPVFQVMASCADAAVALVGLPYEMWSALLYLVLAVVAVRSLIRN